MRKSVALFALAILFLSTISIVAAKDEYRDDTRERLKVRADETRAEIAEVARARVADARVDVRERIKDRRVLRERIGDENLIRMIKGNKILYDQDSSPDRLTLLKRLCTARGGTFNECGSACEEGEICADVCIPACEGITKRPTEVEERIKKELRIKERDDGKRMEYRARVDGKVRAVTVDVQEGVDGQERRLIRFKATDGENKVVRTKLILKDGEGGEGTFIRAVRSDGVEQEVRVTPERVREIALKRLAAADGSVELREKVHKNVPRVVYNVETNKNGRFLGIFKMKMRMNAEVDSETGELIEVRKPWWAFLVGGEDDFDAESEAPVEEDVVCTEEAKTCDDGTTVSRNPDLGCEFDLCPGEEEADDQDSCEDRGGQWGLHYLVGEEYTCNEPTSDGGATCSDSSECESYCEAPEGTEEGTTISGTCYGYEIASCMQEVKGGVADAAWCA